MNGIKYFLYKLGNKKRVNVNLSKIGYIFHFTFFVIGFILLSLAIFFAISDANKEKLAVKTEGVISEVTYDNKNYKAKVKYVVEGVTYEEEINATANSAVSDKVIVKYNKEDPSKIIENDHIIFIIIGGLLGIILLIRTLIYIIPYLKNLLLIKRVKSKGFFVDATVDEVFINNKKAKLFGVYPYRVRLKYVNPADGSVLIFDSQDSYADLKQIIEDYKIVTLPVFLDPKNPNIYYVDLEIILPKKRR